MSRYARVRVSDVGSRITLDADGDWHVPDDPIIPFIESDGIGPDVWRASQRVFDAAVHQAYGGATLLCCSEFGEAIATNL